MTDQLFPEWLDDAMRDARITQSELAEMIGVKQATVSYWLTGATLPSDQHAMMIADKLDKRYDDVRAAIFRSRKQKLPSSVRVRMGRMDWTSKKLRQLNLLLDRLETASE